jgi:hypothetical protein
MDSTGQARASCCYAEHLGDAAGHGRRDGAPLHPGAPARAGIEAAKKKGVYKVFRPPERLHRAPEEEGGRSAADQMLGLKNTSDATFVGRRRPRNTSGRPRRTDGRIPHGPIESLVERSSLIVALQLALSGRLQPGDSYN